MVESIYRNGNADNAEPCQVNLKYVNPMFKHGCLYVEYASPKG